MLQWSLRLGQQLQLKRLWILLDCHIILLDVTNNLFEYWYEHCQWITATLYYYSEYLGLVLALLDLSKNKILDLMAVNAP